MPETSGSIPHANSILSLPYFIFTDPLNVTVSLVQYTLRCIAKGEPNNSTCISWKHVSEQGIFIRKMKGSEYFTLRSYLNNYIQNRYYVCAATNGVPDIRGRTVISGSRFVQLHVKVYIIIIIYNICIALSDQQILKELHNNEHLNATH